MPQALRSRSTDPPPGGSHFPSEFGRFTLLSLLGQGGMGAVFEAEMRGPGGFTKRIALKMLHPGVVAATERMGIDLRTEARLGALLHHPGIVEIYDYGVTAGQPWISMEYVDGIELSDLLRGAGPPPATVVVELAFQLAQALEHAHSLHANGRAAGFVHRDLKPSNVIIDGDGRAKITDFGIAKASVISHATTRGGVTKGTPAYMSPEQARGRDVDGRSDLFSLGVMLYQVATGERLFSGGSPAATVLQVLEVDDLLHDRAVLGAVDRRVPGLGFVLRGCLQEDPDLRWGAADEVIEALEMVSLRVPPGPTLKRWLRDLPEGGRAWRGMRSVRGRSPVQVPHAPVLLPAPASAPPSVERDCIDAEILPSTSVRALARPPGLPFGAVAGLVVLFGFALGLGAALGVRLGSSPPADPRAWRAVVDAEAVRSARTVAPASPRGVVPDGPSAPAPAPPASPAVASPPASPALPTPTAEAVPAPPPARVGALAPEPREPTPPVALPVAKSAPKVPAVAPHPSAEDASMPAPVTASTVGEDQGFVLLAPADDVLGVELCLRRADGLWERRGMQRFEGGRWGARIWVTPAMEGPLPYYFELLRRGGRTELHGRPEAPFVATITR
jgi:serine/threonine protein kinase